MGIEPTLVAWEATVLPLNYTRWPVRILCRFLTTGKLRLEPAARASGRAAADPEPLSIDQ